MTSEKPCLEELSLLLPEALHPSPLAFSTPTPFNNRAATLRKSIFATVPCHCSLALDPGSHVNSGCLHRQLCLAAATCAAQCLSVTWHCFASGGQLAVQVQEALQQYNVQGVHPSLHAYLNQAVWLHMEGLMGHACKMASQRADLSRSAPTKHAQHPCLHASGLDHKHCAWQSHTICVHLSAKFSSYAWQLCGARSCQCSSQSRATAQHLTKASSQASTCHDEVLWDDWESGMCRKQEGMQMMTDVRKALGEKARVEKDKATAKEEAARKALLEVQCLLCFRPTDANV